MIKKDIYYNLKKVNVNELTFKRMLGLHTEVGYIIITVFRGEYNLKQNYQRNEKLKPDINSSGYCYISVWGEFVETDN